MPTQVLLMPIVWRMRFPFVKQFAISQQPFTPVGLTRGAVSCRLMLSHAVSCCLMLSHAISCCLILSHAVSCSIMQYHAISCCFMQYHAVSCCFMLFHTVSCCFMLSYVISCFFNIFSCIFFIQIHVFSYYFMSCKYYKKIEIYILFIYYLYIIIQYKKHIYFSNKKL